MQVLRSFILFMYIRLALCLGDESSDMRDQLDHCPSCANLFTCFDKKEPENEPETGLADSWHTDVYKVERRQVNANGECKEEIKVLWNVDTKHFKTFKPKCLEGGSLRTEYHGNAILIIGSPEEEFFVFSSQSSEYFYKENDDWIKGSFNYYSHDELSMTSDEIDEAKEKYEKWRVVTEAYNQKTKNVDNLIFEEKKRHEEEVKRLARSTEEEDERYGGEAMLLECQKGFEPKSVKGGLFGKDKCKTAQNDHESILKRIEMELKKENVKHEKENKQLAQQLAQLKKQFDKDCEDLRKKKI